MRNVQSENLASQVIGVFVTTQSYGGLKLMSICILQDLKKVIGKTAANRRIDSKRKTHKK